MRLGGIFFGLEVSSLHFAMSDSNYYNKEKVYTNLGGKNMDYHFFSEFSKLTRIRQRALCSFNFDLQAILMATRR